ncbi:hypothetical protein, partial [Bradyrhizobium sp. AS23.2]|uniref:hypothetical protein n=1 Tax=Bradyrhizobium sp. AS23.2 TaxID=1680155 RepID=UPI0009683301
MIVAGQDQLALSLADIEKAYRRIKDHVVRTPLLESDALNSRVVVSGAKLARSSASASLAFPSIAKRRTSPFAGFRQIGWGNPLIRLRLERRLDMFGELQCAVGIRSKSRQQLGQHFEFLPRQHPKQRVVD